MNKYILILLLLLQSCSSTKINILPTFDESKIKNLAILPSTYPAQIQREKIDSLRNNLESELRNNGFEVIADRLVRTICSSSVCPERSLLADKYSVDSFVNLEVRSVQRANFIAGFVNTISGKISITDPNSNLLLNVDHIENERGGLVFNSGQVVQGLISSIENTENASFNKLSGKFIQNLVAKIPKAKNPTTNNTTAVTINTTSLKQVGPQLFEICADATPQSLVGIVIGSQRTNLREKEQGKYCSSLLLDANIAKNSILKIEARSPFGNSVRKEIQISSDIEPCNLDGKVVLSYDNKKNKIDLLCKTETDCKSRSCLNSKLLVFKAPSSLGPYKKVAEIKSTPWTDITNKPTETQYYQIVTVNKDGVWSLPFTVKPIS